MYIYNHDTINKHAQSMKLTYLHTYTQTHSQAFTHAYRLTHTDTHKYIYIYIYIYICILYNGMLFWCHSIRSSSTPCMRYLKQTNQPPTDPPRRLNMFAHRSQTMLHYTSQWTNESCTYGLPLTHSIAISTWDTAEHWLNASFVPDLKAIDKRDERPLHRPDGCPVPFVIIKSPIAGYTRRAKKKRFKRRRWRLCDCRIKLEMLLLLMLLLLMTMVAGGF